MNTKQIIVLCMPVILLAVMYPVFQLMARKFGKLTGWHFGLVIYWIVWGAGFPFLLLGSHAVMDLMRPQKMELNAVLLMSIPVTFAAIGRIFFGIKYEKESVWDLFALLVSALGNGIFEELLWRGTY